MKSMSARQAALAASSPNIRGLLTALCYAAGAWALWDWRHGKWE